MAGAWRTHWSLLVRVSLPQFQVFTANLSSYFFRFMFIVLEPVSYKYCIILVIFIMINRLETDTDRLIFPLLLPFLSFLIVQLGTQAKENCFPCYLWVLELPWQCNYAVWALQCSRDKCCPVMDGGWIWKGLSQLHHRP